MKQLHFKVPVGRSECTTPEVRRAVRIAVYGGGVLEARLGVTRGVFGRNVWSGYVVYPMLLMGP